MVLLNNKNGAKKALSPKNGFQRRNGKQTKLQVNKDQTQLQ